MKVLAAIVAPPHLSVSGGARAGEQLSTALAAKCDITIANMMRGNCLPLQTMENSRLHFASVRTTLPPVVPWTYLPNHFRTLFYRSDIPQMINRNDYDLVHLHNPLPALEFQRIAHACRVARVPYVISTHGFNEVANGKRIYAFDPVRKLVWQHLVEAPVTQAVRGAAAIFALSPADFGIIESMGYSGLEVPVISNGVAMPMPADEEADRAVYRRLGIPVTRKNGQITCMFLANHTPNKGLPILFAAFAALERPYLLVVGGEKRPDVDYESAFRSCRAGQQIVVTGRLEDHEVAALFRRSDIFVFPTLADTLPLAVLEAMSHGLPVIASNVGGIPYQIGDRCGSLVKPGSSADLAAAIDVLAEDPERRTEMGQSALARVTAEFTWGRAAEQALASYERVLSGLSGVVKPVPITPQFA